MAFITLPRLSLDKRFFHAETQRRRKERGRSFDELQEKLFLQSLHQVNKKPDDILAEAIQEIGEIITKAVAHQESIQKDFEKAQKEAKYWNEKAKIALQSNDDDLALQSVVNKKIQNKIAVTIQIQLQHHEKTINILVQNLMVLENVKKIFNTLQNQDILNTKQIIDLKSIIIDTEIDVVRRELDTL
ncbi:hypothetical protein PN471_04290 [Aphanizomenon sp. CS-733/32]|uniref:PspA/IM30 family protein n=1 Tax=Aphanizomenon sp. CS-733/32 TaxID=3021715 RepID=UPI00232F6E0A|nr:hypothetical protein [Aphanizomenon sp. CS-733/32]MDB9307876.1 hypothetical protein [Aphanizomenon sp. CS-733/32]